MKRLKKTPIVIATTNPGKLAQFADLFAKLTDRYDIVSLKDVKYKKAIIENGKTFKQNSLIKARTVSKALKCIAIADDSGLCINSLHG
jgi:XTP/dITP diphosphohydrolase